MDTDMHTSHDGLLVVTGASSNHFGALQQLLGSLRRLDADVVCYDLGLAERERRAIYTWRGLTLRGFDFARYPEHLRVEVNAGEYAWKPVIVAEMVEQELACATPRDVVWVDAGTYFHALAPLAAACWALRFILPPSQRTLARTTLPPSTALRSEPTTTEPSVKRETASP